HGTPCAIANPVQAHVCGDPVQETRRISRVDPFASFENAKEYVLTRVERFILIAQKLSTASEHHRSVPAAGVFNIQLLHAGCITPRSRRSVTAADCWWLYGLLAFLVTERTKEIGFVSRLVHSWADSIVVSRANFRPECPLPPRRGACNCRGRTRARLSREQPEGGPYLQGSARAVPDLQEAPGVRRMAGDKSRSNA